MFERQCQYSLLFGRLKGLINPMFELQESGTVPPCIYPHVYLTSCMRLNLPGVPPLFLHTASDKKLEMEMTWERGYWQLCLAHFTSWIKTQLCTTYNVDTATCTSSLLQGGSGGSFPSQIELTLVTAQPPATIRRYHNIAWYHDRGMGTWNL